MKRTWKRRVRIRSQKPTQKFPEALGEAASHIQEVQQEASGQSKSESPRVNWKPLWGISWASVTSGDIHLGSLAKTDLDLWKNQEAETHVYVSETEGRRPRSSTLFSVPRSLRESGRHTVPFSGGQERGHTSHSPQLRSDSPSHLRETTSSPVLTNEGTQTWRKISQEDNKVQKLSFKNQTAYV